MPSNMITSSRFRSPIRVSCPAILLLVLIGTLWLFGGASRPDVLGQAMVRTVSWGSLVLMLLIGPLRPSQFNNPVFFLLCAALVLALLQLVPLPPGIWEALPGRAVLREAAAASGQSQPWRPLSIVPAATLNAAGSLIVPFIVFVLITSLGEDERGWVPGVFVSLIFVATIIGLLQFSGAAFDNPFINKIPGQVSGIFANRNHFALLISIGCLVTPVWAFQANRPLQWRGPVAIGLLTLFALTILAIGSRAGLLLGAVGILLGAVLVRQRLKRELSRYPRWIFIAVVAGFVAAVAIIVLVSLATDRAVSIQRALTLDPEQDLRRRALPTVLAMIRLYFPVGSGLGGFDPVFRINEPFDFLMLTYMNHAHNDMLEVVLDAGLPGLLLLVAALLWWIGASFRAWRANRSAFQKLGSAILLLILIASIFDYPARTPTIMAVMIIAGVWLSGPLGERSGSALPRFDQDL